MYTWQRFWWQHALLLLGQRLLQCSKHSIQHDSHHYFTDSFIISSKMSAPHLDDELDGLFFESFDISNDVAAKVVCFTFLLCVE
jgi:hypothetical protein